MLPKQSVSAGVMSKVLLMGVVLKLAGATAAMPGRNVSFLHKRMVFIRLRLRLTPFTFIFVCFKLRGFAPCCFMCFVCRS